MRWWPYPGIVELLQDFNTLPVHPVQQFCIAVLCKNVFSVLKNSSFHYLNDKFVLTNFKVQTTRIIAQINHFYVL